MLSRPVMSDSVTPWTAARQASSCRISWSLLKFISIALVMPSGHLILWCPLLLLPSVFPSIRDFSSELAVWIRWPKYWSFSFSIIPSNEYSGLDFSQDWLVWSCGPGILRSLLQHHSFHQFFGTYLPQPFEKGHLNHVHWMTLLQYFSSHSCFMDPLYSSWALGGAEKSGHFLKTTCLGWRGNKSWRSPFPDWGSLPWPDTSLFRWFYVTSRLPWWLSGKESVVKETQVLSPGSGRSPGEGNGNPLQYSCLENPRARGTWQATVHGVTKSQTWLSN